jgi:hypothetical protein
MATTAASWRGWWWCLSSSWQAGSACVREAGERSEEEHESLASSKQQQLPLGRRGKRRRKDGLAMAHFVPDTSLEARRMRGVPFVCKEMLALVWSWCGVAPEEPISGSSSLDFLRRSSRVLRRPERRGGGEAMIVG